MKIISRLFRKQNGSVDFLFIFFLLFTLLAVIIFGIYISSKPEDPELAMWKDLVNVMDEVCINGVGYDEAPEYSSDSANSIFIAPYTRVEPLSHTYEIIRKASQNLPDELIPTSVHLPNLVACLDVKTIKIQVCEYINGSDVARYKTDKFVSIRSVKTGEIIYEETFEGEPPRACKKSESSSTNRLYGESIQDEEIANWIVAWLP